MKCMKKNEKQNCVESKANLLVFTYHHSCSQICAFTLWEFTLIFLREQIDRSKTLIVPNLAAV